MAAIQDAALVERALQMALARRCPQAGLLHHSDRGNTDTSESYLALLQQSGRTVSMSCTAKCYDNAVTESFFHSFTGECIDHESFQSRTQARNCTFESSETFYNRTRRHSTLQYMSPVMYEQLMC
jgi:putative transposase